MAAMPGKLAHCQTIDLVICGRYLHIEEDSCCFCHTLPEPTWSRMISVCTLQYGIEACLPSVLEIELSL